MGYSNNGNWDASDKAKFWSEYSGYGSSKKYYCSIEEPSFTNGRMKVQNADGLWGYINESGEILGSVSWSSIGQFIDGMAMVCANKKYGFINEQGQTIGEVRWNKVNNFSYGYAAVQENGYWGFINKNNELVIPCQYTEVASFKEDGTCDVKTKEGTWKVINSNGNVSFFGSSTDKTEQPIKTDIAETGKTYTLPTPAGRELIVCYVDIDTGEQIATYNCVENISDGRYTVHPMPSDLPDYYVLDGDEEKMLTVKDGIVDPAVIVFTYRRTNNTSKTWKTICYNTATVSKAV